MKNIIAFCLALSCAPFLHADVTNVIDIAALAGCGTGTVNGWTVNGIDAYADRISFRLNDAGEFLLSPNFDSVIKEISLKVKSSSRSGRRLALFPCVNGEYTADGELVCDYSPTKDTYVMTSFLMSRYPTTRSFKIALDDPANGATGWGVSELTVITADPPHFSSPESVRVDHIQATCARVRWDPNEFTASNLVTISIVSNRLDATSVRSCYDFDLCANANANDTQDKSADLSAKYPDLSAEKIYYPATSSGVIRMSTGSANGRITHVGYPNYDGMTIEITAKRYSGDSKCHKLYAYYLNESEQPVTIGSMNISDEFTVGRISLDGTPGGVAINFGNLDGYKSNRRYLIDRIAFLESRPSTSTTTNVVMTATTAKGNTIYHARGLEKLSAYVVTVTAIDTNGIPSAPSAPVSFKTAERNGSMMLRYR